MYKLKYLNTGKIIPEGYFMSAYTEELFEQERIRTYTKLLRTILYFKYEISYLNKVMKNKCENLIEEQHNKLLKLLQNLKSCLMEHLIPGKQIQYIFNLKKLKVICSIPYPVPKLNEENLQKEVELLVLMIFPENSNESEWGVPCFSKPKPKTNQVHFLSYFRNLNKKLNHKPYPMPNINEMLLELDGFQYVK